MHEGYAGRQPDLLNSDTQRKGKASAWAPVRGGDVLLAVRRHRHVAPYLTVNGDIASLFKWWSVHRS